MVRSDESLGEILIVDDLEANREIMARLLARAGYHTRDADGGESALALLEDYRPDLILLDVSMPRMSGFEVCEQIKASPETEHIPVIFVSALSELGNKVRAFEVGAVDYIIKPYKTEEVLARVRSQVTLAHQRKRIMELDLLKDQLMRTVSHDLKNPLHIIMGYAAMMMEGSDINTETMMEMAAEVYRSADKMYNLVTNFLDLSQIEDGLSLHRVPVSIKKMAAQILQSFALPAEQKAITLLLSLPDDDVTVEVDPLRIEQVFNNLVSNAIKYTPDGGKVTISAQRQGSGVTISVSDTGLGIPPDALPHLFDKFFRVQTTQHKEREGTGLGLSIVKAIVEQHGGSIDVTSEAGKGSRFSVYLPSETPVEMQAINDPGD